MTRLTITTVELEVSEEFLSVDSLNRMEAMTVNLKFVPPLEKQLNLGYDFFGYFTYVLTRFMNP